MKWHQLTSLDISHQQAILLALSTQPADIVWPRLQEFYKKKKRESAQEAVC